MLATFLSLLLLTQTLARDHVECTGRCDEPIPVVNENGETQMELMMRLMQQDIFSEMERQRTSKIVPKDIIGQAVKCSNGFAGEYPCNNVDLLSYISHKTMGVPANEVMGNDIWGWTDPRDQREYAIVCQYDGTTFVDVSDPVNPRIIGRLKTHTTSSTWRDAKVFKNHAFIVSEATGHGVQSFDLMQLRDVQNPGPKTYFNESGYLKSTGRCHNIAINEESATAFCVGSRNVCRGGLYIIDISEPKSPRFSACYQDDGYVHDTQCVIYRGPDLQYRGREICFGYNEDHLAIVDVTDRSKIQMISKSAYNMSAYTHQGWLMEDQSFLLLDDELDEKQGTSIYNGRTTTYVWDVSSLKNPKWTATHVSPVTSIDHNQYVLGDYSYQANYASGLRIVDISKAKLGITREAGNFDVRPEDNKVQFLGSWSVYPYFPSGNIVVNSIERGLFVVKANL